MTAIASTDVTIVITKKSVVGREKMVTGTIAFGNGSLTYPSGGVPMPAVANFRLVSVNRMHLEGNSAVGLIHRYEPSTNKIRIWWTGAGTSAVFAELGTSDAPAAVTLTFEAYGR